MHRRAIINKALKQFSGPLGPFTSIEKFEHQRREWCSNIEAKDVDILLDLLVEGSSCTQFDPADLAEVQMLAVEALVEFAHKNKIDLLPKILSRLDDFTEFLHVIELLGLLADSNALSVLTLLNGAQDLNQCEMTSLVWAISQTGHPEMIYELNKIKESSSGNLQLRKEINTVIGEIKSVC